MRYSLWTGGFMKSKIIGLNSEEVKTRVREGKANYIKSNSSQSVPKILFKNLFTYFNLIFGILAFLLIMVGSFKNLTFLPVVIVNVLIGIFQQLRAKKTLDKLALMDINEYITIRDGKEEKVLSTKLVLDDVIKLENGQQIPADAIVLSGEAFVNESLLTGEVDEIKKVKDSELKSGSFIVAGNVIAKLTSVGKDSYINKLSEQAKEIKEKKTEMINAIEKIVLVSGIVVLPVSLALLYEAIYINEASFKVAITSMVGATIGMIPEGLYLLVTVALAISAMNLGKKKVLLHDMKSIETLARIDVLCVDKTGTITANKMSVTETFIGKKSTKKDLENAKEILNKYINTISDTNITMDALKEYCKKTKPLDYTEIIPFSSKNKCSIIKTKKEIYKLGAPEFILDKDTLEDNKELISERAKKGERVLVLVEEKNKKNTPIIFISLINEIRENATKIFSYFYKQGIDIKVISGDNPETVSKVAERAHIKNVDKYIDATKLKTYEDIKDAVDKYTIFGRVQPEQKQQIVRAIKETGLKVAMTGDGVNDILAMKEADCSIAMGEGSDAARQAAQVVLLDSDFSKMEDIVYEGRKDINNITRSSSLFLYKNLFSFMLSIFAIIMVYTYPLQSTQLALISMCNIGIPSFLLALEPNERKQDKKFISQVLINAFPAAITSFIAVVSMIYFAKLFGINNNEVGTACVYLLAAVGFNTLIYITRPLKKYHIMVFAISIGVVLFSAYFLYNIFDINDISLKAAALCIVFAISQISINRSLSYIVNYIYKKRHSS